MADRIDLGAFSCCLDTPMVVVTTAVGDDRAGCLVGFHSQCSITPERYVVWLSKKNRTFALALRAPALAVHSLTVHDYDTAVLFGSETSDDIDKFAKCAWQPGLHGVPLLDDVPTRLIGHRVAEVDGGDHVGIVLAPDELMVGNGLAAPLRYRHVQNIDAGHPA